MKYLRYGAEAAVAYLLIFIFRLLPTGTASAFGGFIGRTFGPLTGSTKRARRNLAKIWPDMPPAQTDRIINGMWDNLGRVMAEYPHLEDIALHRAEMNGLEHVEAAKSNGQGVLFVGGHLGNWEVNAARYHLMTGDAASLIYREPNNPFIERLLGDMRSLNRKLATTAKNRDGRELVNTFKAGLSIAMLIDQKYNEGHAVPFLGFPAMTSTAFVKLARKYNYAIIPARLERLPDCHFRTDLMPPLALNNADGTPRPDTDIVADIHRYLDQWIADKPEQWIWLHRRWSSKAVVDLPRVHAISLPQ
jgi:KDO2-lipid IV(A) lauroyltransferase